MKQMVKSLVAALVCTCGVAFAAETTDAAAADAGASRAAWLATVGTCAADCLSGEANAGAAFKAELIKLPAKDQLEFLAAVNAAIAARADSQEAKTAAFLVANRIALTSVDSSNRLDMLAKIFATVPPEALTVVNEVFAEKYFNRNGGTRAYTDEEFTAIAKNAMAAIVEATSSSENAAVRNAFAAIMFARASGGSPADLADTLADMMPSGKDLAKSEWIPAALGKNQMKSYDAILGAAQATDEPDHDVVVQMAGIQSREALLGDLQARRSGFKIPAERIGGGLFSSAISVGVSRNDADLGVKRVPRVELIGNKRGKYYNEKRGDPVGPSYYEGQD